MMKHNKELFLRMIPVSVTKRKTRENIFFPDRDFIIYAYTGDAGIREKINLFHAKILLKNTGLEEEVRRIRNDGADILEPFIRQHQAYQAIYPDSFNTLRIHTCAAAKA